ncbi:MAG TPA: OmpA family protein [Burkholderiaceae bacterium]|nr:OmpA family protein [Burkholderiaceae bacterium]
MHDDTAGSAEAPPILDRPEPVGFRDKAWPILVLGFITVLLIRACVPSSAPPPPPAPFDTAGATQAANARAIAALDAIRAGTPMDAVLVALNLPTVNFASGSAEIPPDAKPVLVKAALVIKGLAPTVRLEIAGHTDSTGTAEANMLLSRQRAQAVADFLVASGVPRERLSATGYGDARPVATNATEEGRFHNRRIEVRPQTRGG